MADSRLDEMQTAFLQRQRALSRWEKEGGTPPLDMPAEVPELTNTELVHLRIRVIALENLVIALLAEGSDRQLEVAREMATYISPRAGFTQHPLTVRAGHQVTDMVERAVHYREVLAGAGNAP